MKSILVPLDCSATDEMALKYASRVANLTGSHLNLLHICRPGSDPMEEIVEYVQRHQQDLVAMATHGRPVSAAGSWEASQTSCCTGCPSPYCWLRVTSRTARPFLRAQCLGPSSKDFNPWAGKRQPWPEVGVRGRTALECDLATQVE
jgi:hypothetical protein